NSLGLQNKKTAELILEELNLWAERAVNGHFDHPYGRNWKYICDLVNPTLAYLVATSPDEVACTGSLTTNLHLMMTTFYRPTKQRYKILFEKNCFPSDMYAFTSQAKLHGLDPKDALLMMSPRPGEYTLRTEDILSTIHRESIALIIFPGVKFYTGQVFPMKQITMVGHQYSCVVGFKLAPAVGNIVLELNSWKVDFDCWCSYKYLNAGPGAIAGIFLHEDWFNDSTKIGGPNGRSRSVFFFRGLLNSGYFEIQLPSYCSSNVTNTGQNSVARIESMRATPFRAVNSVARIESMRATLFTALEALAGYFRI
ncbi:pyridoxal phosphate-dependent transferase, partial [Phakopsora pachyrhizi]